MTQQEEPKGSVPVDDNVIEHFKYRRFGHIDEGKVSDDLALYCFSLLAGGLLPPRWRYAGATKFVEKFGSGGQWSRTASYHGFFFDGDYIFRIWTDAGKDYAYIDISSHLFPLLLQGGYSIESIPPGSHKKCKPMVYRIKMKSRDDIDSLLVAVRTLYKA